jgi:hypothetical protein
MKQPNTVLLLVILISISACQALGVQNPVATLEANNVAYIAEATSLAMTAVVWGTQVMATTEAIQTQVMQVNTINQHLLATVVSDTSPTPPLIVGAADPSTSGSMMMEEVPVGTTPVPSTVGGIEGTQFTQIGTAGGVRQSDGCANALQSQFAVDTSRIYITARAFNLRTGTAMSASWSIGGTVVVTNSPWNVDRDYDDICVWFYISQEDTPFTPGDWSVSLLANNQPIEPAISFTIVGQ